MDTTGFLPPRVACRTVDLTAGAIVAGKFRLDRPLARGGMGSVWVAFNTQLEMPVALKFMAPALVQSAELVARFEREAKAAAQLRNPHVVQIFEYGVDRGTPFMAMELLEGEDLGARLKARRRLSLPDTARILGDVCKALQPAHEKGLVHRDLKPPNIFLCQHDGFEMVKVLDFGIAKSMAPGSQDEVTQTGAIVGSPHYMAPEQARRTNKQVDHRSDLWSLGVIAFRCITGALPFAGDDLIDVLVRVCTEAPPTPSSVARDLGPEVDRFFARALSRDPAGRFQSAREMAEALSRLAGRDPMALDRSWSDVQAPPRPSEARIPAPRASQPSRSDAQAPPPRPSQPSSSSAPIDPLDDAKTVPIHVPSAQKVIEAKPWMPAGRSPLLATLPLDSRVPAPTLVDRPGSSYAGARDSSATRAAPSLQGVGGGGAQPGASGVGPAGNAGGSIGGPTFFQATEGTLTNAGTELSSPSRPAKRDKPWVILAAVAAAVLVIGIIVAAVFLGRGTGEGADGSADDATGGVHAAPDVSSGTTTPAGAGVTSAPPAVNELPATAPKSAEVIDAPAAASTEAPAGPGTGAPASSSSTAKPTGTVGGGTSSSLDDEARRALGADPAKGKASPTASAKAKGGYLAPPKF